MRVKKKKNKDRVSFSAFPFGNPHLLYQSDPRRNMNDLIFSGLAPTAAPVSSSAQISRSIYATRPSRRTSITCAKRVPYRSGGVSVVLLVVLSGGTRIVFLRSSRFRGGIGERVLERKKRAVRSHILRFISHTPSRGGFGTLYCVAEMTQVIERKKKRPRCTTVVHLGSCHSRQKFHQSLRQVGISIGDLKPTRGAVVEDAS